MNGTAFAGAEFIVTEDENKAKEIVDLRKMKKVMRNACIKG